MRVYRRLMRTCSRFSTVLLTMPRPVSLAYSTVVVLYAALRSEER